MQSLLQSAPLSPAQGSRAQQGSHGDMVYQAMTVAAIILVLVTVWVF